MLTNFYMRRLNLEGYAVILINQLENEREKYQEGRSHLTRQIKNLKAKNRTLQEDRADLGSHIENLEEQNKALQEDKANLSNHIENLEVHNRALQDDKADLGSHIENLEAQILSFQEDKANLSSHIENLEAKNRALQKDKANLSSHNENLERQNHALQDAKANLSSHIGNLEAQNLSLQEDKANLSIHIENLEAQDRTLQDEKSQLNNMLENSNSVRNQIVKDRNSLHNELEKMQQEMERLQNQADRLAQEKEQIVQGNFAQMLQHRDIARVFINKINNEVFARHHRSVFWGDRLLTLDKSAGFYEEEKFRDCHNQINQPEDYDQYAGPDGIAWRLNTLVWAAKCALYLSGDFVECGVFKGDMSWVVANVIDWAKVDKTFYLYDTFEGFSPKYTSQEDFPFNPNFLDFANNVYRIPQLYEQVCERFKQFANIKVIKGVLPDTLYEESPEQIAFLHIDLNSAKPEIGVLEILFKLVVSGGIIIFDDYGWMEYVRQKRAEDAFMGEREYSILELPTGQGIVVKR